MVGGHRDPRSDTVVVADPGVMQARVAKPMLMTMEMMAQVGLAHSSSALPS